MLMLLSKFRPHYVLVFLFAVFAAWWFYVCNRYFVLYYHEQMQLFRFDGLYFRLYLNTPGGISGYLGSFLTQFYYYPVAGSFIIAAILASVYLLFYNVCNTRRLFFIPFIPVVLLMMSFMNIYFDMSMALGILFVLIGFKYYMIMSQPVRYIVGLILAAFMYFIAGGNVLLLSLMIIIFEIKHKEKEHHSKKQYKFLYLMLLFAWSALLPWIFWRIFYIVPLHEAYFALTPANFLFPTVVNNALWLSFPVLYYIGTLTVTKMNTWKLSERKIHIINYLLAFIMIICSVYTVHDRRRELLHQMEFDLQIGNWKSVIAIGKDYPTINRRVCYFTNIALAESGQMPYRMFHYKQIGVTGLFLDRQLNYFSLWNCGEIYYRLGMIQEAEHNAFESLLASPKEPNAQALRRLTLTNIARRDSATAEKYLRYFDNSLTYRKWARNQRSHLELAMADSAFHIPDTPIPRRYKDFFINYHQPDYSLLILLESDPNHRLAFEYLMAYYMLQKNIEQTKWCLDSFFENFNYQNIPTHYEEALLVYHNSMQLGDDFFTRYPVSQETRERFSRYAQAYKAVQGSKRNFEQLQRQFGNTYWYYMHFIEPSTLKKNDEQNRY